MWQEIRRFSCKDIPQLCDIAITQDHLMIIGYMEKSLCRS